MAAKRTITRDLVLSIIAVVVLISAAVAVLNYRIMSNKARVELETTADEYLAYLVSSLELPIWAIDNAAVLSIAESYGKNAQVARLKITVTFNNATIFNLVKVEQSGLIVRTGDINHAGQVIGQVTLGLTSKFYRRTIRQLLVTSVVTTFLISVSLTGLTLLFSRMFLKRPIDNFIQGIEQISEGNYDYRFSQVRHQEIQTVIFKFISMADRIRSREKSLRESEDEMRRLQNLLGNIVNSMPSVLVGIDSAGVITQWNQQAEAVTGVSAIRALGRNLKNVYAVLAGEMENVRKAIAERTPQVDEKVALEIDGETRYSDITVYPLVANGIEGAVIRMDDVTERVRIEEIMIQNEKMASVGGLAAGMAHEINNPLGVILQSTQNISRRLSNELEANSRIAAECGVELEKIIRYCEQRKILKYVDGIHAAGSRASKIVANMLNFSRRSESTLAYVDINRLIDATIELAANDYDLKKKYDFRHIDIERDYASGLPRLPVATTEIEQVILNLLKNAAQATVGNQTQTPKISVRTRLDSGFVVIELSDNGSGMDEATRKRAFEPFFTTKKIGEGTGLGLSVSYFIITNNHKGTMSVQASPGKGSRFFISLPLGV